MNTSTSDVAEEEADAVTKEVVSLFADMSEQQRAEIFEQIGSVYCLVCGSDLPEAEDEECPCRYDEEDDGDDSTEDDDDEDDVDAKDSASEGEAPAK